MVCLNSKSSTEFRKNDRLNRDIQSRTKHIYDFVATFDFFLEAQFLPQDATSDGLQRSCEAYSGIYN